MAQATGSPRASLPARSFQPMPRAQRIAVGADHRGAALAATLRTRLAAEGFTVLDHGTHDATPVDYPAFAFVVGEDVCAGRADWGLLVCGSGIGMAIAANKVPGVRAAICDTTALALRA